MKIKATVDKYCYTSKPTDSDAKKNENAFTTRRKLL